MQSTRQHVYNYYTYSNIRPKQEEAWKRGYIHCPVEASNLHWTAAAQAGVHIGLEEGSTGLEVDTGLGEADTALGEADTALGEVDTGQELDSTGLEGAVSGLGAGMEEAVQLDLLGGKTCSVAN